MMVPGKLLVLTDNSLIGLVEIGLLEQFMDVQFNSAFEGAIVQSTKQELVISGGLLSNENASTSSDPLCGVLIDCNYVEAFHDRAVAVAWGGAETSKIGGTLFSEGSFGQLDTV